MRCQAHQRSRYGLQPVIVIGGDDRLPETAAVLIPRWARRYCSELAPIYADAQNESYGPMRNGAIWPAGHAAHKGGGPHGRPAAQVRWWLAQRPRSSSS
jgi:hypothetical protein